MNTRIRTLTLLLATTAFGQEGQPVAAWVEQALQTVREGNFATPAAGRVYAMVTVAMYDAVNGIDTAASRGRQHAMVPADGAPAHGSRAMAAAAAAHAVLTALAPIRTAVFDAELVSQIPAFDGRQDMAIAAGLRWGEQVGRKVVELRMRDGTQAPAMISASEGPGKYRVAFDSRWRSMAPFGIASKMAYVAQPPPSLRSDEFAAALTEVKNIGRQDCDPTRNEIADFWLAEAGTVRETGTWLQAGLAVIRQQGTMRSASDTARLFALLGMAIADAVIVSWETKATYMSWRPMTAIHEAEIDPDPGWRSRAGIIGASPEYSSGTSTFAGAASQVMEQFYGRTRLSFCFQTDGATSGPRCYESPAQAAVEAGRSRIIQGIHFRFADEEGRRLGQAIGREIATRRLGPR